jgi:putative radical SAM enzyme (TIGR03279 family)
VVCPGINDGQQLEKTLLDLAKFHSGDLPTVISVAVVPVGLTRFRPTEDQLMPVSPEKAIEVIQHVKALQQQFQQRFNSHFAWLADEWFLIAQVELPSESDYEDYPQIGNGVGSIRQFCKAFMTLADRVLPEQVKPERHFTWVVGNAVERAFAPLVQKMNGVAGLRVTLAALNSDYWGQAITVTGLLTGQDLIDKLSDRDLGQAILLPALMLKHDDTRFLDDLTVETVAQTLNVPIFPVQEVKDLLNYCVREDWSEEREKVFP